MLSVKFIRNENNRLSEKLNKENQEIYTDIVCYLRVSDLTDIQQEEVISDILSMFFDWEKQDKKIKDMIGEDYKRFADDIIVAINPHKSILQKIKEYVVIIIEAVCFLLTIDFLFLYLPEIIKGNLSLIYEYSLGMAVRGLIIFIVAVVTVNYIGKNSFSLSKRKPSKLVRFLIGVCTGLLIVLIIFLSKALSNVILISIDIRYIITIVSTFWIYKIIRKIVMKNKLSGEVN